MADLTKLKGKADKGSPPAIETKEGKGMPPAETNDNLNNPPRETPVKKTKIEFSVPEHMANAFSQEAGHRFGFKTDTPRRFANRLGTGGGNSFRSRSAAARSDLHVPSGAEWN